MNEIRDMLGTVVAAMPAPAPEVLDADVERGRRALLRRRAGTGTAALGLLLGVGIVLAPLADAPPTSSDPTRAVTLGRADPDGALFGNAGPATPLVPYTGAQTGSLSTALIPQGWVVQGGDAGSLTLAPADASNADPASYENKIVVLLEGPAALDEPNARVDGRPAVLVRGADRDYSHVYVPVAGWAVHVQVPPTRGADWSDQQLLDLAAGITVQPDGAVTHG